jgi:DNA-binding NarL/FixJ family response regulator
LTEVKADVVITDLLMPGVEGLETNRTIRRLHSDVCIIAISGIHAHYLEAASKFGANAVLRKPFDPSALREAVARAMRETVSRAVAD